MEDRKYNYKIALVGFYKPNKNSVFIVQGHI